MDLYLVEAQRTIAYAKATNDPIAEHLGGELAPPVFAVVPVWESLVTAMAGARCDGDPRLLRRIAVRFSRPVLPGQEIVTRFWGGHYETVSDTGAVVVKNGLIERS